MIKSHLYVVRLVLVGATLSIAVTSSAYTFESKGEIHPP